MPLIIILLYLFASNSFANTFYNSGNTYQSSNNGSISIVNGIVIDGQVVSDRTIAGNKKIQTKTRKLTSFNQLQVDISADIEVIHSSSPQIIITAEENIIPLIITSVVNNRLILKSNHNFWTTKGIKIKLYTEQLKHISINGSANIVMFDINQNQLDLHINGAGDVNVSGSVKRLTAIIDGTGDMRLENLKANSVVARIMGSGDIRVYATHELSAEIMGSGDIGYRGHPKKLKKSIMGSGDIDEL
ncbi:MAG: head GIN domain-containing protein [Pseudomonadota bacterium]